MSQFTEMVLEMVAKAIDEMGTEYEVELTEKQVDRDIDHDTALDILAGYDSRYMTRNDYRVARKIRYGYSDLHRTGLHDDNYFNYISDGYDVACEYVQPSKKVNDSSDGEVAVAKVKQLRKIPDTQKFNTRSSDREYTARLKDMTSVRVLGYKVYHKAIVLEVIDQSTHRDVMESRSREEQNPLVQHIVFRYAPFLRNGQPNPYDGFTQFKDFMHSIPWITSVNPSTIGEVLDLITGTVIDFPSIPSYNYTSRSDRFTVYQIYGDFTDFDNEFSVE